MSIRGLKLRKESAKIVFAYVLAAAVVSGPTYAQSSAAQIAEFDAYVQKAVTDWEVPGLAVAVVKDGRVIFSKGYGVRRLGGSDRVDSKTMSAIASTTKAMTAACVGMLVDEGKLKWEDRVSSILPKFLLNDPYTTRELTVRDLLIHNSGVGNADFLWGSMNIPPDSVLYAMRMVKPSYSMRSSFIYQNIFYLAAGRVIEKTSGMPWSEFIRQRIFLPLRMTRTVPLLREAERFTNRSTPHFRIEEKVVAITDFPADQIAPAGAVWSCVDDMASWLSCLLDSSKYGNERLLKPNTWKFLFTPQTIVPPAEFYPTLKLTQPLWMTYGLGWFQHDYKGRKLDFHTGSLNGTIAIAGLMHGERTGVYILANLDHAEVRHALMYKAFDLFAVGGDRDWSTEMKVLYDSLRAEGKKKEKDFEAKRVLNTSPTLPPDAYAGTYADTLYGTVVITVSGQELHVSLNRFVDATLRHWHYDVFRGMYDRREFGKVNAQFQLNAEGKVASVEFDGTVFMRK